MHAADSPDSPVTTRNWQFGHGGRFELQLRERRLLVDGQPASLGARAFDVLTVLAEHDGRLVTRRELMERIWPDVVVEDNNLNVHITALRKIVGGDTIVTIPGRGYRFASPLVDVTATTPYQVGGGMTATQPSVDGDELASKLRTNLPASIAELIGREDDMAALSELIGKHRLVSIVGGGGMGKTLMSMHLLKRHRNRLRHGVCWIELSGVPDGPSLPAAVAAALGLQSGRGDALAALCEAVAPLEVLMVLDNAEHLLEAVAHLAHALVDKAPGVSLLVTSQAPLKLPAERVYRIGPLSLPQGPLPAEQALGFGAVALFVERAQAADARFVLTDANAAAAIELCQALDGVALAIELAAARAPMLGVQRLAHSMGERLKVLNQSTNRDAPARQKTLRAALEWSHGLLEPREQIVFRRLAIMAGSADLELIQQVVANPHGEDGLDEWAVVDALSLLIERSLVMTVGTDDVEAPRYRLLESPRAYALERLAAAGEHEAIQRRHLQAMARRLDFEWERQFDRSLGLEAWRQAIRADLDNAQDAFAAARLHGDIDAALTIAATALRMLRGSAVSPGQMLAVAAEELTLQGEPGLPHLRTLLSLTKRHANAGPGRLEPLIHRAEPLARMAASAGDPRWLFWVLNLKAWMAADRHDLPLARRMIASANEAMDRRWTPQFLFVSEHAMAERVIARESGDDTLLLEATHEHLRQCRASGDNALQLLPNLVDMLLMTGDVDGAIREGTALVAQLDGTRFAGPLAYARLNLSAACIARDDTARVRELTIDNWPAVRQFGMQAWTADYLALMLALEHDLRNAARLAGYADAVYARTDDVRQQNEITAITRARALIVQGLGDAMRIELEASGAEWRDEQVEAIVFAAR